MLSMYPACFYKEEDGYSVIFPDLNYLATQGDSLEDAMEMAIECLAAYLHSCKTDGEAVPAPSNLTDINPVDVSKEVSPDEPVGESFVIWFLLMLKLTQRRTSRNRSEKHSQFPHGSMLLP